jgi:hypothetical protein
VEQSVLRRYLRQTTRELVQRREALGRAVERLDAPDKRDFVDVADAVMAHEATGARVRWLQDRLDRLGSRAEYDRRFGRELAGQSGSAAA